MRRMQLAPRSKRHHSWVTYSRCYCGLCAVVLSQVDQQPESSRIMFCSYAHALPIFHGLSASILKIDGIYHDWLQGAAACRFQMCKPTNIRLLCCFVASRHATRGHFDAYGLEHCDQLRLLSVSPHSFCPPPHLVRGLEVRIWARVHPICLGSIRIRAEM